MEKPSFLDYEPVALGFGTSGLRGLVKDLTDLEAYINVKGALEYLMEVGDLLAPSSVVLAGDLRPSTARLLAACAQAIRDCGCEVEHAGFIPTPALILFAMSTGRPGVMVTGSHIPFDRNGIKVNKSVGEVLKTDEPGITRHVERVRAVEYARSRESSKFDAAGSLRQRVTLPAPNPAAEENYVRRYLESFGPGALAGMRVLVYQHSAVGRDLLPRVLADLGAEVSLVGRSETFIPIDTENISEEQLDRFEAFVAEEEARDAAQPGHPRRPIGALVSTDGDSDRPLVCAVLPAAPEEASTRGRSQHGRVHRRVPRRVRFLSGDLLGIVVAEFLGADAVAVPISANDAVQRRMKERGVLVKKTRIGSPWVIAGMIELASTAESGGSGRPRRIAGWEANGGFLLGSAISGSLESLGQGGLSALPTRDALLPILVHLHVAARLHTSLAEIWDKLPARFGRAGLIDEVPVAVSRAMLARCTPSGDAASSEEVTEVSFKEAARVVDGSDAGGLERDLEEPAASRWRECKRALEQYFTVAQGFDEIARINRLDGIRLYFANGDVAHFRPSGNAPQLRAYSNSHSQQRADEIVTCMLREPDGILRRMQSAPA